MELERIVKVAIYDVREIERVVEHDSPALGCTQEVISSERIYQYFLNLGEAEKFIKERERYFQRINSTLKPFEKGKLDGVARHHYSNYYEIEFSARRIELLDSELTPEIQTLVKARKKRIIGDKEYASPSWNDPIRR